MMLDIDFFKSFNDHYGHLEGDKVIESVANTLQQLLIGGYVKRKVNKLEQK
jgi:diguanylate cyclase (GGDEF)-like protein